MYRRHFLSTSGIVISAGAIHAVLPFRFISTAEAATLLTLTNAKTLWFPGRKEAISKLLETAQSQFKTGSFTLLQTSITKENPVTTLYTILETAAIKITDSIPVVGWIVSGFLALGFKSLSQSLSQTSDYKALIESMINQAIDENNYRLMRAAFEGVSNVYLDYGNLLSTFENSPPTGDQRSQLISQFTSTVSACEQHAPTMLLKDSKNGYSYQGLPLYCSIANIELCSHSDILKKKFSFNLEDPFYLNNYQTMEKKARQTHKNIRSNLIQILEKAKTLSHDYPSEWARKNSIIREIYLSGLGGFLESYRRRYEAQFFKPITLRNSIEIYSNSYASQETITENLSKDILHRTSPLARITGYSHIDRVQRIGLGYEDSDNTSGWYKQYETCTGRVGDGNSEKDININYSVNPYSHPIGNGAKLPVKYYANSTQYATYGIRIIGNDDSRIDLGQLNGDIENFYNFGISGHFLTGLIVTSENESGKTCQTDSGASITFVCSVHRHWSSMDYIAVFAAPNIGIELDSSVLSSTGVSSQATGYADYLIGKNIIKVPSGSITYRIFNNTPSPLNITPVLMLAIPGQAPSASTEFEISIGNSKTDLTLSGLNDAFIQGLDGEYYMDAASKQKIVVPTGESKLQITRKGGGGFNFASALLIPS
ncbi:Tat pathway signal protein [Pseudomonas aeruginosa]|nr:Tat pathway signal protein [Pseudomonas aeruginosa]